MEDNEEKHLRAVALANAQAVLRARERAEEALRASEEQFRVVFNQTTGGIAQTDLTGRFTLVNDRYCAIVGRTREELLSLRMQDITHPDDVSAHAEQFHALVQGGPSFVVEKRYLRPDGSMVWVYNDVASVRDSHGRVSHVVVAVTDITERKRAGEALRQSEERFARFMQHLPGLAWIKDEQGRYVYANDAAQNTFQIPKERLYGKTDEEVFPPEVAAQFRENDRFALTSGTGVQVVETFQHPDGLLHHSIVSKFPIFGSDGQTALIGGIGIDITERKQAENALRESEERFRAFINATSDVVYRVSTDWTEMRHLQGREFIADTLEPSQTWLNKYIHPEDQRHVMETIQRAIQSKSVFELEHRVIRVDGSLGWTYSRAIPILDDRGEIVEWFGAASDVTQRKQAEEALRKAKERVDIVSEAAEVGFWFSDLPFDELIWDNRVKKHFWLTPDANVTIQTFYERLHPDDRERTRTAIEESIANKARYDIEYRTMSPEGKEKWIRAIGRTFYDEHEKPIRFDGVTLDITQRKRTEERLTQFTAELEERVAERTYELAESEDQLRTLATELNLAEQRERKRLATELHDHLQQLLVLGKLKVGQSKRLTDVAPAAAKLMKETDDVLSEALTYTRTLVSDLSPTVLRDYGLAAALQWLGTYMQKHDQTVTVTVPHDEDLKLPEDQVILLFQSVRELLINSSKHAGTGEATVRMEQRDGLLRIDVRDEGAGFDLAAADATGTPSGGISSKFGLFSIRERMRALGGSFEIKSAPGKGTTATLMLPVHPRDERDKRHMRDERHVLSRPVSPLSRVSRSARVRVLLVDDHPMVRQGLRSIVTAHDHFEVVGEAGDGAEAVELAQWLVPDVVVMDINMPNMDGIEATRQMKASQPTTVVIGLSVNQSADTERKMKAAGASAYLAKERAVDALCPAIIQALSSKPHRTGSDPSLRPSEIKA